jgi:hypothetical protein
LSYGTSISYGSTISEATSSFTNHHSTRLTGLTHTTRYHFNIVSTDIDGNIINSDDYVFDTLPMPKVSNVNYKSNYNNSRPELEITWKTNVATTSTVEYVPRGGKITYENSKSELIIDHKALITDMMDQSDYEVYISGADQFGNQTEKYNFSLATPKDSRPPIISDVQIESSNISDLESETTRLIISWKTDEPATSSVEYGEGILGEKYNKKSTLDSSYSTNHMVIISSLKPNQPYHLRAVSLDKADNTAVSEDNSVVSGNASRSILNMIIDAFMSIFGWLSRFL